MPARSASKHRAGRHPADPDRMALLEAVARGIEDVMDQDGVIVVRARTAGGPVPRVLRADGGRTCLRMAARSWSGSGCGGRGAQPGLPGPDVPGAGPGRAGQPFASPADFNTQLAGWLALVSTRPRRVLGCSPAERITAAKAAMLTLPPVTPVTGCPAGTAISAAMMAGVITRPLTSPLPPIDTGHGCCASLVPRRCNTTLNRTGTEFPLRVSTLR